MAPAHDRAFRPPLKTRVSRLAKLTHLETSADRDFGFFTDHTLTPILFALTPDGPR